MLLGVDWGTSTLRGALLDDAGRVIEERSAPRGILTVEPGTFHRVFEDTFGDWFARCSLALVSGMAGSRQGWVEAPYCECPAGFAEIAAKLQWIEPQRIAIVPGLSCEKGGVPDVMRGEETQVLGAMRALRLREGTFVLPGTHSKWVDVREARIERFATSMTGEFYALLLRHSILARTLPASDDVLDEPAFLRGLAHAREAGSLLQSAFSVRTLALFDRLPATVMPSYLSGLVIGEELRSKDLSRVGEVVVVANPELAQRYALALGDSGVANVRSVGSQAAWQGLAALASELRG